MVQNRQLVKVSDKPAFIWLDKGGTILKTPEFLVVVRQSLWYMIIAIDSHILEMGWGLTSVQK